MHEKRAYLLLPMHLLVALVWPAKIHRAEYALCKGIITHVPSGCEISGSISDKTAYPPQNRRDFSPASPEIWLSKRRFLAPSSTISIVANIR